MSVELTEKIIVNKLFDFIEKHFDDFKCKGSSFGWWWSPNSWSPFVEACFIIWGEKLISEKIIDNIGHSFIRPNITKFMGDIGYGPYDKDNKYPDKNYDLSWHYLNKLILALEHEETTSSGYNGSIVKTNLKHISDEIDKLNSRDSKYKIIVTRPRLRKFQGRRDNYPDAIEFYREHIESILLKINTSHTTKWLIILIGPTNKLKPDDEAEISFCSYVWDKNKLTPACDEKRFTVKMNENFEVKKV